MRTIQLQFSQAAGDMLEIGASGEHLATRVVMSVQEVLSEWPEALFSAVVQRADGVCYPLGPLAPADAEGNVVIPITGMETACAGPGRLEVRAVRGGNMAEGLAKTCVLYTMVRTSLREGDDPPAPPRPDWVDELLEALAGAGGGVPGPAGQDGKAATIAVGQTETVAHDMAASVVNVGTETDAVLDFTIPRGAPGSGGGGTGGIAEDSEKLGGQLPGYYAKADHVHSEYLTAEDDPAVPEWAKQPVKPTYTAAEIGAAAAAHSHSEYLAAEDDPTVPSWAKQPSKPIYDYAEITGTPVLATVATSGAYADLAGAPAIPTTAADVGAAAADHSHAPYEAQMTATDSRLDSLIADLQAGKYTLQMAIKAGSFTDPAGVDIRRGAMDTTARRIFA